ncbi:uncharacterized protein N7443_009734 [Penicillium atrosanguineum]|uniref:uncharacterized protein n=1 Tax=Penicillium atrosanguineum TaxID=1132637 RepID=UPI002385843B|nr:uncharacterized protein N7443_009734 [Penicillium atrosanguineum]KAJ5289481.1 hypothetical protein N7443_009734 [Penicillium atrosanguineum]
MAIQYEGNDKHLFAMENAKAPELPPPPYTPESQYLIELPGSFPEDQAVSSREDYRYESRREPISRQNQLQYPPPPLPPRSQPQHPSVECLNQPEYGTQAQWNGQYPYSPADYNIQYQPQPSPAPVSPMTNPSYRPDQAQLQVQRPSRQSQKPCVIPLFGGAHMSPFARARAQELEQAYGITAREMLAFVDGLNEAFIANPVLQATSTIGNIVGFIPIPSAQIVGNSVRLASGLGMAATSIMRTKQYMAKANEIIFKPRNLHAQICKTEKMLMQTGIKCDASVFAQGQYQIGEAPGSGNHLVRRMDALGDRVTGLSFDVEAPVSPDNWLKKMGSYSAQRAEQSQLKKLDKKQVKADKRNAKDEKKGREKDRRGNDRRAERAEKLQSKETEKVKGLLWIVITAERESLAGDDDWDSGDNIQRQ